MDEMNKGIDAREEDSVIEVEIDISKRYLFPKELEIVEYKDTYLVIYTEGIMWLVLQSKEELKVFKELQAQSSVEELLEKYDENVVMHVLMQIEAKKFESPVKSLVEGNSIYIFNKPLQSTLQALLHVRWRKRL